MDVDAQLEHIFEAVASGGPLTIAQARAVKEKVARLRRIKARRRKRKPEPLVLTPAESTRVAEFNWTKVKEGAKTEPEQSPLPISSRNSFSVLSPPNDEDGDDFDASRPGKTARARETAYSATIAAVSRDNGKKLNEERK